MYFGNIADPERSVVVVKEQSRDICSKAGDEGE
jgi:hypothetical protein